MNDSAPAGPQEDGDNRFLAVETSSMTKHAVSGVMWSVIQTWGGRMVSTVVFVIIGRLLTPSEFGLVSLASVMIEFGALLTVSGFHRAIVQRENLEPGHLHAAFWSSVLVGLVLFVGALIAAPAIATVLDERAFTPVLRALSASFVVTAVAAVPAAILHRRMVFRAFALRQLLATAVGGVTAVALAVAGAGAWALVGQTLASGVTGAIVVLLHARWLPRWQFSRRHWRDMAGFGVASLAIDIFDLINNRLDDLLIGVILGATALGYYGVAYRTYAIALEIVAYSMSAVAFPILSRIVADRRRAGRALVTGSQFANCVTLPVFILLACLADRALLTLFGEKWEPAVVLLRILSVSAAATTCVLMSRDVVLAAGRPRLEVAKMIVVTASTALAIVIGVQWGVVGVAWGQLAVAAVIVPVGVYGMRKVTDLDLREWVLSCVRPLPACAVMAAVVLALDHVVDAAVTSVLWLIVEGLVGVSVYVAVLWLTARSTVSGLVGSVRHRNDPATTS